MQMKGGGMMSEVADRIKEMITKIKPTKLYPATQVARMFGVAPVTLRRWIKEGIITAKKVPSGSRYMYYVSGYTILDWLGVALEAEESEENGTEGEE